MRTVTFADERVKAALGDFALAWKNIKDEPCSGTSFRHKPEEEGMPLVRGIGNHNVQVLFLTPKGELLHALAGYWGPDDFLREVEFVTNKLLPAAKEGKERVSELHAEHAKADKEAFDDGGCGLVDKKTMRMFEDKLQWVTGWKTSHKFMAKNALVPVEEFRLEKLVGNAQTFFGYQTMDDGKRKTKKEEPEDEEARKDY